MMDPLTIPDRIMESQERSSPWPRSRSKINFAFVGDRPRATSAWKKVGGSSESVLWTGRFSRAGSITMTGRRSFYPDNCRVPRTTIVSWGHFRKATGRRFHEINDKRMEPVWREEEDVVGSSAAVSGAAGRLCTWTRSRAVSRSLRLLARSRTAKYYFEPAIWASAW